MFPSASQSAPRETLDPIVAGTDAAAMPPRCTAVDRLMLLEGGMPFTPLRADLQLSALPYLPGWPRGLSIGARFADGELREYRDDEQPQYARPPAPLAIQQLPSGAWQAAVPSQVDRLQWRDVAASNEPVLAAVLTALIGAFRGDCWRTLAWICGNTRLQPDRAYNRDLTIEQLRERVAQAYWNAAMAGGMALPVRPDPAPRQRLPAPPQRLAAPRVPPASDKRPHPDGGAGVSAPPDRS